MKHKENGRSNPPNKIIGDDILKDLKTSEAQRRAIENWAKKNPDAKRYHRNKSNARTYARKYAKTLEEVEELVEIFKNENPNYKA